MERFYMVYADDTQRGPYSVAQLEYFLQCGEFTSSAFVWTEGMTDWQPIATVVAQPVAARRTSVRPASSVFAPRALQTTAADAGVQESDYTYMLVAHILMAASVVTGVTAVIAVIMAYVKRDDLRGTYLESHAKNLIETFWWSVSIGIIILILFVTVYGFIVGLLVLIGGSIWFAFRCIRAIARVSERKAI